MTKKQLALVAIIIVILGFVLWWTGQQDREKPDAKTIPVVLPEPAPPTPEEQQAPQGELIGEKLLHAYASDNTTVRDDLQAIQRLSLSYITLVKTHADRPIGCNGDLADALRGKNPYKQRFLPDGHPAFSDEGEIIDRWGTPIFLHTVSAGRWDVRSAGPDRKLWTEDDLQLQPNGKFVEGTPDTTLHRTNPIRGLPTGR